MDRDPKYLFIGLTVVVLTVGLVLFLLWSIYGRNINDQELYSIFFKEQSLSGLQKDGAVTMRGIKIGSIRDVEFQHDDIERVLVIISVDADTPIKVDTQAVIRTNFVTGLSSIDLIGTTQAAAELKGDPETDSLPVIPEGQTQLDALQSTLPEIIEDARDLMASINNITSDKNIEAVGNIVSNMETISAELAKRSPDIGEAVSAVSNTTQSIENVGQQIEKIANDSSDLIKSLGADLESLIITARDKISKASNSIIGTSRAIKHGKEGLLGSTETNLLKEDK